MPTLNYLAYGSNLHPLRLSERIRSSRLVGVVELPGHRLAFHKRGMDGSGKCNLVPTGLDKDLAFGAVFAMDAAEQSALDEIEGPGYARAELRVDLLGGSQDCFVYLAEDSHIESSLRPYAWYQRIVCLGAEFLGLPASYQEGIARVRSRPDPVAVRATRNAQLIARLQDYPGRI